MAKAYFITGPSGSGKTTLRNVINEDGNFVIASSDDYLMEKAQEHGMSYQEAYGKFLEDSEKNFRSIIEKAISENKDIIIDRTLLTVGKRAGLMSMFSSSDYEKIALMPDEDTRSWEFREILLDVARSRDDRGAPMPEHVILAQCDAYQPPEISEGFDKVRGFTDMALSLSLTKDEITP